MLGIGQRAESLVRSAPTVGGVAALCCAIGLAGCGGSSGSESSTETTTTSAAKVTSFDVGDLRCGAGVSAPVDVTWTTEAAAAVDIKVDDFPSASGGPSGMKTVTVPCDDESHQIAITPIGASGPGETETKHVSD